MMDATPRTNGNMQRKAVNAKPFAYAPALLDPYALTNRPRNERCHRSPHDGFFVSCVLEGATGAAGFSCESGFRAVSVACAESSTISARRSRTTVRTNA